MTKPAKTTRFLTRWGFALGIFAFVALGAVAVYTMSAYRAFSRLELHTNEVISQLRQVESVIERAETSQRGYLLTKNISFLRPYHKAVDGLDNEVSNLRELVADNGLQSERVKNLSQLIDKRIEKMQSVVEDSKKNPLSELANRIDIDIMVELREVLNDMEAEELRLLDIRRDRSLALSRSSFFAMGLGGLFALFLMVFSARLVRRSARRNEEQTNLITQVFDSMSDGLIVIDHDMRIIHSNSASNEISERDIRGMTLQELYNHSRPVRDGDAEMISDWHNSSLYRALKGETVLRFEVMMGKAKRRLVSVDARAVRDGDGEIVAAFCTYQDITQRRETEEDWKNARESALQASRLKSDFLATMSHEIRTPMNGVMGMATLLLNTSLNPEQESFVRTIKSSSDSLLSLINQVLDHSKIEAGKLELDKNDFDLSTVIDGVMSLFRYLARSKDIELKVVVDANVPPAVNGDANRLRQILLNLVGNALKFTERGYVELHVGALNEDATRLEFSVKDTGPGIPAGKQQHLFQKFSQVHDSKYVKAAGSGLGLMISRELVKAMNGDMGMESVVGLGSRFWFTAEFGVAETVGLCEWKPSERRQNLSGRILVAEDQIVNQTVIQKFLESFGLTCVIADEGGAAVNKARAEHYDLIFMDCRMIPMDGYEATRQIRAFNSTIPIVALTAEGVSGERKLCLDAGMNDVMTKPVDIEHLYTVLKNYLSKPEFDEAQLDKLAGYDSDDKTLIEVLSDDFFTNGRDLIKSIKDSIRAGDAEQMKHYAHALRSPALTLGLTGLAHFCAALEDGMGPVQKDAGEKLDRLYNGACAWLGTQTRSSKAS